MKKYTDIIVGFLMMVVLVVVMGYFVKQIWNTSIVPVFRAQQMTMHSSMGLLTLVWLFWKIAAHTLLETIRSALQINVKDASQDPESRD